LYEQFINKGPVDWTHIFTFDYCMAKKGNNKDHNPMNRITFTLNATAHRVTVEDRCLLVMFALIGRQSINISLSPFSKT
jgi:hypothetical protein